MLIGFTGYKGVGKDTAANHLVETFGFTKLAFADKMKMAIARLFNIKLEFVDELKNMGYVEIHYPLNSDSVTSMMWREFIQRFGTEMGRETFWNDFWVNLWEDEYDHLVLEEKFDVVVPDVRFKNEADMVRQLNGVIVEITRPGYKSDGHASEEGLPRDMIDAQIANNGSLKALEIDVYDLYKALTHGSE